MKASSSAGSVAKSETLSRFVSTRSSSVPIARRVLERAGAQAGFVQARSRGDGLGPVGAVACEVAQHVVQAGFGVLRRPVVGQPLTSREQIAQQLAQRAVELLPEDIEAERAECDGGGVDGVPTRADHAVRAIGKA
eukprot:scaffold89637_cov27-Tisochrysis_lutea.AAC.3